jgi:PPOX class probable F420-dependent enzyme
VSRRDQIRMSDAEVGAFLDEERTVICATIGRDGFPHLMPLWYVVRDGELWAWTFAKSQKVRNLERDPRATLQIEAGKEYAQLRGVMLKCDVTVHRDTEQVAELGTELFTRYRGGDIDDDVRAMVRAQAPKRVALQFTERSRSTWDHRKLAAGVY